MKILSLVTLLICLSCMEAADNPIPKKKTEGNGDREDRTTTTPVSVDGEIKAQAFRVQGEAQLTYSTMTKNLINAKEDSYRIIPNPDHDHDAKIKVFGDLGSTVCGIGENFISIAQRVADCETKLGKDKALWSGKLNGISGEGDFSLVLNIGAEQVWRDNSTGLIWSSEITQDDWSAASGYQVDITTPKFACNNIEHISKSEVTWRLPTRSDFLQADIDGARFVLPRVGLTYWTATSVDRGNEAWVIHQGTGRLETSTKNDNHSIRCVGHILK